MNLNKNKIIIIITYYLILILIKGIVFISIKTKVKGQLLFFNSQYISLDKI
jgi:hypothetical protein